MRARDGAQAARPGAPGRRPTPSSRVRRPTARPRGKAPRPGGPRSRRGAARIRARRATGGRRYGGRSRPRSRRTRIRPPSGSRSEAVRVAAGERRAAGGALLHRHADLGEDLAGGGRDRAVADPHRVDPPRGRRRCGAVPERGLGLPCPVRVVARDLDPADVAARARGLELGVRLRPLARDPLERRMREQREVDASPHRREGDRRRLHRLTPVDRDRHHRPVPLSHDPGRHARAVGDRVQRLEGDPPPHPLRLPLVGGECDPRQDVATGGLDEDALAAGRGADHVAQRAGEVRRVDDHVEPGRDGVAPECDRGRDRRLVRPACLQHGHLVVDEVVGVPAEDRRTVGALATVDGEVGLAQSPGDPAGSCRSRATRDRDHTVLHRRRVTPRSLRRVSVVDRPSTSD